MVKTLLVGLEPKSRCSNDLIKLCYLNTIKLHSKTCQRITLHPPPSPKKITEIMNVFAAFVIRKLLLLFKFYFRKDVAESNWKIWKSWKCDRISLKNSSLFYDVVASDGSRTRSYKTHVHNESARNATTTIQAAIKKLSVVEQYILSTIQYLSIPRKPYKRFPNYNLQFLLSIFYL